MSTAAEMYNFLHNKQNINCTIFYTLFLNVRFFVQDGKNVVTLFLTILFLFYFLYNTLLILYIYTTIKDLINIYNLYRFTRLYIMYIYYTDCTALADFVTFCLRFKKMLKKLQKNVDKTRNMCYYKYEFGGELPKLKIIYLRRF